MLASCHYRPTHNGNTVVELRHSETTHSAPAKPLPLMNDATFTANDLQEAFQLAPVGLCVSHHRVIQHCNETFAAMFGYQPAELIGQSLERLYPSLDEFEHIGRQGLRVMRESGCYSDDRIMRHRNGQLFWCHVSGRAFNRAEPFARAVWSFRDLSAERPVSASLTTREREIAQLLVAGRTSKQIARSLEISHRTVEAHRARLMRKMGVATPGEMIARLAGYQADTAPPARA